MDKNVDYLLRLLKSYLYVEPVPVPEEDIDWNSVIKAAAAGEVISLIYKKLSELPQEQRPSEEMMGRLKDFSSSQGFEKIYQYNIYSQILQMAEERGIQVISFKGPVLANLYPEPFLRNSCDIDLYVDPPFLKDMEQLLKDLGFTKNEEHSKECVPVYVLQRILMVEVHCCLFEDYKGKQIDKLTAMDLTRQDKRICMEACGLEITTMGHEDHLVFLLFHLIKHISYNGCSLKTIIDIVLFINAYWEQISKENFWKKMKYLGYDTFCRTLFSVGVCYFGMTEEIFIDDSYSANVAKTTMEKLYQTGIIKASMDNAKEDRRASSIAFQSFYEEEKKYVSRFRMWLKALFPSSKDLSFRYMYARRHPSLVWIAWIHRAFHHLTVRCMHDKEGQINMAGDVKLANQKLTLLKELDLMNKD